MTAEICPQRVSGRGGEIVRSRVVCCEDVNCTAACVSRREVPTSKWQAKLLNEVL